MDIRLRARTQIVGSTDRVLLRLGASSCKLAPCGDDVVMFLNSLAAGGPEDAILDAISNGDPGVRARFEKYLSVLDRRGFIERDRISSAIHKNDLLRFDRFFHYLSEFETSCRSRYDILRDIGQTTVVLVGIGGQGSWIVYQLLCLGIGRLRLIDPDIVEMSNLNRSILFDEATVGRPKVEVASEAIARFSPRTRVETARVLIRSSHDLLPHLQGADLVVGAADTPPRKIRTWIAEACHQSNIASVQASGFRVGPFTRPGISACVGCDWEHQVDRNPRLGDMLDFQERLPQGASGLAAPVTAITAGVVGLEIARYLVGAPLETENGVWSMDGYSSAISPVSKHPRCKICSA